MRRFMNLATALGLSAVVVLVLLAVSVPASGNAPPAAGAVSQQGATASVAAPAVSPVAEPGICSADDAGPLDSPHPHVFGRTCRCSCGYPCRTDADCGGAVGSCSKGISCC